MRTLEMNICKKAEDRLLRGSQSLAHGDILFERYVFGSVRVALFFVHLRKGFSLMDRVQYTDVMLICWEVIAKLWDIVFNFLTGYDGKRGCHRVLHTLF